MLTVNGILIATFVFPIINKKIKLTLIKWWSGGLLRAFNISVIRYGEPPALNTQGVMFVANHISWVDIHAINSLIPLRFIAKSEIKSWPVFGYLVSKANTLFIERGKRQEAGRIVEITSASLKAGDNLCFFPEGTTTEGALVLPFKSSVLQAAISANTHIWPVAIRYPTLDGSANTKMAYAGDTSLVESMSNILKLKNPTMEVTFLSPIHTSGLSRQALAEATHSAITKQLNL